MTNGSIERDVSYQVNVFQFVVSSLMKTIKLGFTLRGEGHKKPPFGQPGYWSPWGPLRISWTKREKEGFSVRNNWKKNLRTIKPKLFILKNGWMLFSDDLWDAAEAALKRERMREQLFSVIAQDA